MEDQLGFSSESLLKSIKNNRHNHLTATYYLLLKRFMIKMNKPYLESFFSADQLILKYSRVRHSKPHVSSKKYIEQKLRDKNQ
jgi:hypothetical protein